MEDISQNEGKIEEKKHRYLSIDMFKGIAIILMVFINSTQLFENLPAWSKHAVNYGLTYVDLVAPFFIFMMALNFRISFSHRLKIKGRLRTYLRYIYRYTLFIIIGLAIMINIDSDGVYFRWGTLQVLGAAGLLLLPFIEFNPLIKIIIAGIMMTIHQFLLTTSFGPMIIDSVEGGIIGSLSWGSMMILSSVLAEGIINHDKIFLLLGGIVSTLLGITFNFIWVISRNQISISYILISVGFSSLIFYGIYYVYEIWGKNKKFAQQDNFISLMGKNAFMLFLVHLILASFFYLIFPLDIPLFFIILIGLFNVFIIWLLGFLMHKFDIFIII